MRYTFDINPDEEKTVTFQGYYNRGIEVSLNKIPGHRCGFRLNKPDGTKIPWVHNHYTSDVVTYYYEPKEDIDITIILTNPADLDFLEGDVTTKQIPKTVTSILDVNEYPLEEVYVPFTSKIDGSEKILVILIGYSFGMVIQ